MESSTDGEAVEVDASMMRRWADAGRVLQAMAPELFRRTLAATEVTISALSTAREDYNG